MTANFRDIVLTLGEPRWWMAPAMVPRYERFNPLLMPPGNHAMLVRCACSRCDREFQVGIVSDDDPREFPANPPYHEVNGSRCDGRLEMISVQERYVLLFGFLWRPAPAK